MTSSNERLLQEALEKARHLLLDLEKQSAELKDLPDSPVAEALNAARKLAAALEDAISRTHDPAD